MVSTGSGVVAPGPPAPTVEWCRRQILNLEDEGSIPSGGAMRDPAPARRTVHRSGAQTLGS